MIKYRGEGSTLKVLFVVGSQKTSQGCFYLPTKQVELDEKGAKMEQNQTGKSIDKEIAAENRAVDVLCKMMHSNDTIWPEFRVLGKTKSGKLRQAKYPVDDKKI